jgi:NitT/TauT family transport system permease protein
MVFFPIMVNTVRGLTTVDPAALELMRSYAASEWQILREVRIPNALPFMFTALKVATTLSVIGAVVGEWVGGQDGIGPVMLVALGSFDSDVVFAGILWLAIVGCALFAAVVILERFTIPWYRVERGP